MKVPFYQHSLGTKEIQSVTQVLHSLFLTTGPKTAAFEKAFAQYLGAKHAIGVSSWTMGGLITLLALDIGPGDEVITTPLTFIATANVIVNAGAKPVFVDVEPETGNINVRLIQKAITKKTKAILPVHLYGQMCDMRAIRKIADEHGLVVIEDAAHCVEGMRDGIKPGTLSDAAIFSFYATKNLACGEGGAVVTNHTPLAEKLRLLRLHGMSQSALDRYHSHYQHWDMKILGHKCNMSDLQAALLLPQLERLEILLKKREQICQQYENAFSKIPNIQFPSSSIQGWGGEGEGGEGGEGGGRTRREPNFCHARHLFTIWVDPKKRDQLLQKLQQKGIGVAVHFRPVYGMEYYRKHFGFKKGLCPLAEKIGASTITLPLYPKLSQKQIHYVIQWVKELL